jgi:hypothetical protein
MSRSSWTTKSTPCTPPDRQAQRLDRATLARLALLAATLALAIALSASPALAATATPTLIAPAASSAHNSPLSVEYELPEAGANATLSFIPPTGPTVTVTLTSPARAAGKHHFFLDLHELEDETANVAKASASSLPDGAYTVTLSYQNVALEPFAGASAEKVTIKTLTSAPTLSEPTGGQSFRGVAFKVAYELPEPALPGSVKLLLFGSHAGTKPLLLTNSAAGAHTAEVVPSNPSTGIGIASASSERLPADSYQLTVSYQDALGNPAASTVPVTVTVAYPLCEPGTYSTSGEEPCLRAPKGCFVPSKGATVAAECTAGHYASAEGLSECVPAQPGHYVPGTGAKEELECEQGTYSGEAGRSSCISAPTGHYAPRGAIAPTACPAGTFDAHTNSPSAEFCEYDSPGWYSGEGADEPIPCMPGRSAFAYGSEECLPAPPGSYVSSIGATDPTPCPAGSFTPVAESVSCITTPENTYATGGASEPTPCPAGTHAPAGASSCTPMSSEPSGGGSSQSSSANGSSQTGAGTETKTPAPAPIAISAPGGAKTTFAIAATRHGASLARTRRQLYTVSCSAATTVQLRVDAFVQVGKKRLALAARAVTLKCKAAKTTPAVASFRLTPAAKKLLGRRGASVKLTVSVYATGAAAGTRLAGATLRGTP